MTRIVHENQNVKHFVKGLSQIDRSRGNYEKFRDFCELAYCAHAKLTALVVGDQERADKLEERYMQIVRTYKNPDDVRAYKPLLEIVADTLEGGGIDFLGDVAGQLEILNRDLGQIFTPYSVSRLLAKITLGDLDEIIARDGYITMSEPAVGAGGIVLAVADELQNAGYNPMNHMLVEATDISPMAFHMCFIQLTFRGVPARVIRGNSLSLEVFEVAWTPPAILFAASHPYMFEKPPREDAAVEIQPNPEPVDLAQKLTEMVELIQAGSIELDSMKAYIQKPLFDLEQI